MNNLFKRKARHFLLALVLFTSPLFAPPPWTHNAGNLRAVIKTNADIDNIFWPSGGTDRLASSTLMMGHNNIISRAFTAGDNSTAEFIEPATNSTEESHTFFRGSIGGVNIGGELTAYTNDLSRGSLANLIELEYKIKNNSSRTVDNFYVGMYFDFDLFRPGTQIPGLQDEFGYDASNRMYYQNLINEPVFVGIKVLSGSVHSAKFRHWNHPDNFTYQSIADGVRDHNIGQNNDIEDDVTITLSQAFSNFTPGSTKTFTIAIFFGESLAELQSTARQATSTAGGGGGGAVGNGNRIDTGRIYDNGINSPPPAPNVDITSGGGCFLNMPRKRDEIVSE